MVEISEQSSPVPMTEVRPIEELRDSGLLWLINRAVFHPRGFALGLCFDQGKVIGWTLAGTGTEPWRYDLDEAEPFEAAYRTLTPAARE